MSQAFSDATGVFVIRQLKGDKQGKIANIYQLMLKMLQQWLLVQNSSYSLMILFMSLLLHCTLESCNFSIVPTITGVHDMTETVNLLRMAIIMFDSILSCMYR
jgi:polysaccharide export outer membrane protein